MPFERYEILLPLKHNDGTRIEAEKFQQTRRELVSRFGALTMEVHVEERFLEPLCGSK